MTTIEPLETLWTFEAVLAVGVMSLVTHLCFRYYRTAKRMGLQDEPAGLIFLVLSVFLMGFIVLQVVFALAGLRAMKMPTSGPSPGRNLVFLGFIAAETVQLSLAIWAYLKVLQLRLPSPDAEAVDPSTARRRSSD